MADPKRVSFHVGLATYDQFAYQGAAKLLSPRLDARDMYNLARSFGYTPLDLKPGSEWDGVDPPPSNVRIDSTATYKSVVGLFRASAALLVDEGDTCFITFSCHGVQVANDSTPSSEGSDDESVCLFDFIITDDVLTGLLQGFKEKVNVILVLDCCHSGATSSEGRGVLESLKKFVHHLFSFATGHSDVRTAKAMDRSSFGIPKVNGKPVTAPPAIAVELQEKFKDSKSLPMPANVAVFQACGDRESTFDGKNEGDLSVYTRKFIDAAGAGDKTIAALRDAIAIAEPQITNCTPQFRSNGNAALLDALLKAP